LILLIFFLTGNFIQLINLLRRHNPLLDSWFNDNKFKSHHVSVIYTQSLYLYK
jgi:hypothetical protein